MTVPRASRSFQDILIRFACFYFHLLQYFWRLPQTLVWMSCIVFRYWWIIHEFNKLSKVELLMKNPRVPEFTEHQKLMDVATWIMQCHWLVMPNKNCPFKRRKKKKQTIFCERNMSSAYSFLLSCQINVHQTISWLHLVIIQI